MLALAGAGPASGAPAAGPALREIQRLGGLLAMDAPRRERWCWAGTFRYPVGDPLTLGAAGPDGEPGFSLNRNVGGEGGHQGADLDNRRAGDPVRAAAHGIVVSAAGEGWSGGYGALVVLAHRLMDETFVYSVYAHLASGSVRVRPGDAAYAGQLLGRVGRTGRASTAHLHFEIRCPEDPDERWEHARALDPVAFVAARLPAPGDTAWSAAYLAWAEDAGLVHAGAARDEPLDHARWWTMLARAARHRLLRLPDDPAGLRPALMAAGLLPGDATREAGRTVEWEHLERDLERLEEAGTRLPRPAIEPDLHRDHRDREVRGPGAGRRPPPTLAQAIVALADIAGAGSRERRRPRS